MIPKWCASLQLLIKATIFLNYQIKQPSEITHKIKGSKFIARVYAVESREAAVTIVNDVESEHRKASHVCWACRIDQSGDSLGYSSDAGEPRGSAGTPILAAIEGCDLTNVLCVVIRYFGGTKLGIGGLVRAYGGVAAEALELAGRKKHTSIALVTVQCDLSDYSNVMHILRKYRLSVQPVFTPDTASVHFEISPKDFNDLSQEIHIISSATIKSE
ncbi:MAG: YigZ family protein [Candidatus Marinimicrobia bacterium]|nr:YigZ family protein [Candidatus Neomarinimicrobiota bacterium]